MPIAVKQFQPTPNPNAVKCILSHPVSQSIRSYRSSADAEGDPLARALFAIPGVTNLLISTDWLTVSKSPEASWSTIQKAVAAALKALPDHTPSAP